MFAGFGPDLQNLASAITLLLPGFIAVSAFGFSNATLARDRQPLQWVMWSLAYSILLYAAMHGVYSRAGWPNDPLDPQLYCGLLAVALISGYVVGRFAGSRVGRDITRAVGVLLPPWVWVEVLTARNWVVVHLVDGTVLYGYPRRFTDDPRESLRELYLEEPQMEVEIESGGKAFRPLPEAAGVLIDSTQIRMIEVMVPKSGSLD